MHEPSPLLTRRSFARLIALGVTGSAFVPRASAELPLEARFVVGADKEGVHVDITLVNVGKTSIELLLLHGPPPTATLGLADGSATALVFETERSRRVVYARKTEIDFHSVGAGKTRDVGGFEAPWPAQFPPGTATELRLTLTVNTRTEAMTFTHGPVAIIVGAERAGA